MIDNDPAKGGDARDDILDDACFDAICARVSAREFRAIIAAPPCSTFSVARFFDAEGDEGSGPPPVRDRTHVRGLPGLSPKQRREAAAANEIVARTVAILVLAARAGSEYVLENPSDHGNLADSHLFLHERHAPVWLMSEVKALEKVTAAATCSFPMCAFGAEWQKYTTLMYSAGFKPWLDALANFRCDHSTHERLGGVRTAKGWRSADGAAYPAALNYYLAVAIARLGSELVDGKPRPQALPDVPRLPASIAATAVPQPVRAPVEAPALVPAPAPVAAPPPTDDASPPPSSGSAFLEQLAEMGYAAGPSARAVTAAPVPAAATSIIGEPPAAPSDAPPAPAVAPKRVAFQRGLGRHATRQSSRAANSGASDGVALLAAGSRSALGWLSRNEMTHALAAYGVTASALHEGFSAAEGEAAEDDSPSVERALLSRSLHARAPASDGRALETSAPRDPKNRREAMAADEKGWTQAEGKELKKHADNESYDVIDRSEVPHGRKLVKLVWVYKIKRDGTLKARLCVQGCTQVPGVDYDQTFCATMRPGSLRLIASMAARLGLSLRRWDFASAYLQGVLDDGEVVYCHLPPGYESKGANGEPQVCVVRKPIYGMAQAGRRWQRSLFPWLLEQGLTQLHSDPCVFYTSREVDTPSGKRLESMVIGVYVDDLCIAYSHDDEDSLYAEFTRNLRDRWEVEDEGPISDLLAVQFAYSRGKVKLHQQEYIEKLVATHLPDGVPSSGRTARTPCDDDLTRHSSDSLAARANGVPPEPETHKAYMSLVGALLYCATNTRPDVAYAVGILCRSMSCPTAELLADARRVLHYLHRTRTIGLTYECDQLDLRGFSDSDWGVKHSTTGYVFLFNGAAIAWGSKKQISVALSSCEAELMALSEAAKEACYLSTYAEEVGLSSGRPIDLSGDNQAARDLAYNPEHHQRTKHIARRHFFVREMVESRQLRVPFVPTDDNLGDFFTKPLGAAKFRAMRALIMNIAGDATEHDI